MKVRRTDGKTYNNATLISKVGLSHIVDDDLEIDEVISVEYHGQFSVMGKDILHTESEPLIQNKTTYKSYE